MSQPLEASALSPADWIVGFQRMDPRELAANPLNFRVHPPEQRQAWREARERIGWLSALLLNRRTGHLLDGHMRLQDALEAGSSSVPVLVVDCDLEVERSGLLTLNALAGAAGNDPDVLSNLLTEVGSLGGALDSLLAEMTEGVGAVLGAAGGQTPGASASAPRVNRGLVKFAVSGADYGIVERALARAGTSNRGEALTVICAAYLGGLA